MLSQDDRRQLELITNDLQAEDPVLVLVGACYTVSGFSLGWRCRRRDDEDA